MGLVTPLNEARGKYHITCDNARVLNQHPIRNVRIWKFGGLGPCHLVLSLRVESPSYQGESPNFSTWDAYLLGFSLLTIPTEGSLKGIGQ